MNDLRLCTTPDRPQPIDVSTISHQFLSLSTILVMWGHPPDNNDIITNYSLTACLPTGPCSSVSVDVPSFTARVTSYGYNQTYTVAIRAFNGVGGSDATTYFFRSPGSGKTIHIHVPVVGHHIQLSVLCMYVQNANA